MICSLLGKQHRRQKCQQAKLMEEGPLLSLCTWLWAGSVHSVIYINNNKNNIKLHCRFHFHILISKSETKLKKNETLNGSRNMNKCTINYLHRQLKSAINIATRGTCCLSSSRKTVDQLLIEVSDTEKTTSYFISESCLIQDGITFVLYRDYRVIIMCKSPEHY